VRVFATRTSGQLSLGAFYRLRLGSPNVLDDDQIAEFFDELFAVQRFCALHHHVDERLAKLEAEGRSVLREDLVDDAVVVSGLGRECVTVHVSPVA